MQREGRACVRSSGPWDWGQLPTYFSSQELTHLFTYSVIYLETLTDAYCVLALLLGSGNVANVMVLCLVKQSHGQQEGFITGEPSAWCAVETRVKCGLLWLEGRV